MRHALILALVLACACNRHEHGTHEGTHTTASTSPAAAATAPYDLQFLDTMVQHHQAAVDMVKAAEGKFSHTQLADAGRKIVADQEKEIAQMKTWREKWYAGAPPAANMSMPGMASSMNMDMSHMTSMSGNALDLMFIDMMIPHHEGAVVMANDAISKAEHGEIKDLARTIVDAQSREIGQLKDWQQSWAAKE